MTKNESIKLYNYMESRFTAIDRRLDDTASKADIESLRNAVDGLYGLYEKADIEIAAVDSHTLRLDRLIINHDKRLRMLETKV